MTAWRVTHIDVDGMRRQLLVLAVSNERADALAVAVYGPGRGCQCIRLGKGR